MRRFNLTNLLKSVSVFLLSTFIVMQTSQIKTFAEMNTLLKGIKANCTVKDFGETVQSFDVTVNEDIDLNTIKAEDFIIENAIINHGGVKGNIKVKNIKINENTMTLTVDEFLLVKSPDLKVTCTSNEAIAFEYEDLIISSPVADKFESKEYNGVNYKLFSPEMTEAAPLVIWMHGRGDNALQLRTAKNATMFAEDESQAKNPCYVLAPQSDDSVTQVRWSDRELENIIEVVNGLIEEGKVDRNRVYIVGHSMGGQGTWNLLRKAPELFAAAITMAPRVIEDQVELDDLEKLKDLPVWLFHAESDPVNLVSGSRDRYNKLIELGNENVKYTELTDDEMKSFGIGYGSPFEYHATNVVMVNTPGVIEWLFAQEKDNGEVEIPDNGGDNPSIDEEIPNTDNDDNTVNDEDKPFVDEDNKEDKPTVEVDDSSENNNDNIQGSEDNKQDTLPQTGAPIGSIAFIISGIMAIGAGKKLIK